MKTVRTIATLLALGLCAGGIAWADGNHEHGHEHADRHHRDHGTWGNWHHRHYGATIFVGPILGPPFLYSPYDFPPVAEMPLSPPTYIEQGGNASSSPPPGNVWYHCGNPEGYYPYVKDCPGGWKTVTPSPPSGATQ